MSDEPRQEVEHQPTRCKATSKQTGKQCGQFVAEGFEVCKWHGAGAPQVRAAAKHRTELVKAKAQGRLEAMVDAAITDIEELSKQRQHLPTAFNAAKHILDRGIGAVKAEGEKGGDSRPLIQIGVGLTMTPDQWQGVTVIEGAQIAPSEGVIDADPNDEVGS